MKTAKTRSRTTMDNAPYPQYDPDYISGCMSLRKPQKISLKRLEEILGVLKLSKDMDINRALSEVNGLHPTCTDFERDFMSITFALATGVGKTRLMGAFITYLYAQYGIKNFFVVAPGLTVYNKLKNDLSIPNDPKYVFSGIGCFSTPPQVISEDDYKQKRISENDDSIRIFVFNIAKFDSEDAKMRRLNELLGESFYNYLSGLPDLVMIMDESHHYRAKAGFAALNELCPVLGLELTATPYTNQGSKQIKFKNVVYEYPLSKAIEDGYTRTPFAATRTDIDFYNFGDQQLDKLMINDGLICHEKTKKMLNVYANNNDKPAIKPFAMIVCKDTNHAQNVMEYIKSDTFRAGYYKDKVIMVHSGQSGQEKEANIISLLSVESPNNPVEIVIHVNMLKEGWDVNNLYTIIPLRCAASKILREQMVGRGLRLPYGERTGDRDVDAVTLTAHDKFKDILDEASRSDSIFKAGNVIKIDEIEPMQISTTQVTFDFDKEETLTNAYFELKIRRNAVTDKLIEDINLKINSRVSSAISKNPMLKISDEEKQAINHNVCKEVEENSDWGDIYKRNKDPFNLWIKKHVNITEKKFKEKFIPIPVIKITEEGSDSYSFANFDMDFKDIDYQPIVNDLIRQNLIEQSEKEKIVSDAVDIGVSDPKKTIVDLLREKPEIDYEKCYELLYKLTSQVCDFYKEKHGFDNVRNIVAMNKKNISEEIYKQMMQRFFSGESLFELEIDRINEFNLPQTLSYVKECDLYANKEEYSSNIRSVKFTGIKKGVHDTAQFDSEPELKFACLLDHDAGVKNWLRPAPKQFNITYDHGHRYEPDFVVETESIIYLVEVKGEDKENDPNVLKKAESAIKYCKTATDWNMANGYKPWQYVFIPSLQITASSTFKYLAEKFTKT